MYQATTKRLSKYFESCQVQKVASLLTEALRLTPAKDGGARVRLYSPECVEGEFSEVQMQESA
jgi:hypothetical protein